MIIKAVLLTEFSIFLVNQTSNRLSELNFELLIMLEFFFFFRMYGFFIFKKKTYEYIKSETADDMIIRLELIERN